MRDNDTATSSDTNIYRNLPQTSYDESTVHFRDIGHNLSMVVHSVLMLFSAVANITVLVLILKQRRKAPSRLNTMLMHLSIADLMVTFLMIPVEIAWSYTVIWRAGDVVCRIMMFFKIFGLYLSSFVLVCISIDRYFAVLKPLSLRVFDKRYKTMIAGAWIGATICSLPQMVVFHVESHPLVPWYTQCVTTVPFSSHTRKFVLLLYALFGMVLMYVIPLAVIIFSYTAILVEIYRKSKNGADTITRSSTAFLEKAKMRTLKMTLTIVLVFFFCWTPYHVMALWHLFSPNSAYNLHQLVQRGLYVFACVNSCMNPVVYGIFNIRTRRSEDMTTARTNLS